MLPHTVKAEVKDLLLVTKTQNTAAINAEDDGVGIYKKLKKRLLELFGPQKEEAFEEASQLVLTRKPSALAKRIMVLICRDNPPLKNCHCDTTVLALWKRQLPQQVKAAIAGEKFSDQVLKRADAVYATTGNQAAANSVAVASTEAEVEAVKAKPKAKLAGKPTGKKDTWGPPNPDGQPETACFLYWRYGKSAYVCRKPATCSWRSFIKPKSDKNE